MTDIPIVNVILVALALLAFLVNLAFGIFIFRRRKILVNKLFALLMFSFCWWNIMEFVVRVADAPHYAQLASRLAFIALSFIPSIAFAFALALDNKTPSRKQAALLIIAPLIFVALDLGGMLVARVMLNKNFDTFMIVTGSAFPYFAAYLTVFLAFVIYRLIKFYEKCENELVKKRMRYLILGTLITSLVVFITDLLSPMLGLGLPPLGSFSTLFLTSLTYYSVRGR